MSDAKKTHRLTLGKHSEEVTADQLAKLKERPGFAQYDVEKLSEQPAEPSLGAAARKNSPSQNTETSTTPA